jgi:hypothetical protein
LPEVAGVADLPEPHVAEEGPLAIVNQIPGALNEAAVAARVHRPVTIEDKDEAPEEGTLALPSLEEMEEYLKENVLGDPEDNNWDVDIFEAMDELIIQELIGETPP